jgi:hypothetical protein
VLFRSGFEVAFFSQILPQFTKNIQIKSNR